MSSALMDTMLDRVPAPIQVTFQAISDVLWKAMVASWIVLFVLDLANLFAN
jgi:hypothetical protein